MPTVCGRSPCASIASYAAVSAAAYPAAATAIPADRRRTAAYRNETGEPRPTVTSGTAAQPSPSEGGRGGSRDGPRPGGGIGDRVMGRW
ncbi:hypothetical protein GCM10023195_22520 [Actinoallomurus liliacearum]|uniref:Secreted protein n=1 Tax=Actinoallomurus liliacearum TaxID=1080073 RepID=A0ABP8TGK8_9ACTN